MLLQVITFLALLGFASAHFKLNYPTWRGDSFGEGKSQWIFPCANVSETTDLTNRTQWSPSGGSLIFTGSHPWALTYVNLGLGTNVTNFNITLVENFNQTGNGTFCFKETGKNALAEGLRAANLSAESLEGQPASLQVIQISHTGASLYNCADITFNASAALLSDDQCRNATGVSGVEIENVDASPSPTGSAVPSQSTGAAAIVKPVVSGGLFAGLMGLAFGLL